MVITVHNSELDIRFLFVLGQKRDEFLILQGQLLYSTMFMIILFLFNYLTKS